MNKIACMATSQRADLFGETANRMGIAGAVVEKDFWVCWVLKQLFSIEAFSGRLLFKGGTSLSKIFRAINRFSEDIDLAVDYAALGLGFTGSRDPQQQGLSRTKQTKLLAEMLRDCRRYIGSEFIREFRTRCEARLGMDGSWSTGIDDHDPNIIRFHYPTAIAARLAYISPQVVLELGTHAEFIPRDEFSIRPFAAEEFPKLFAEAEVRVTALLAKRTFWATILHAQYHRGSGKSFPARYSRHYYDVAMLSQTPIKDEALAGLQLLRDVVRHKETFYPAAWARYDLAVPGNLKLAPAGARVSALKQDYRDMAMMIFGDPPRFESMMEKLTALEDEVHALASA